jgi:hypothetical protein
MLNYDVECQTLEPLVPPGTMLDTYQGKAYVTLVGFLFLNTKVFGLTVPFHEDFEEVNLRFYVRRLRVDGWQRGVVFIKEIVPRAAIAAVARWLYNENYLALPMRHTFEQTPAWVRVEYAWRLNDRWNVLRATATGEPRVPAIGTLEAFIAEHYLGYARQRDGCCLEYRVEHPPWRVWRVAEASLDCDATALYGPQFVARLSAPPASAFLAEGSPVTVYRGQGIADR